MNRIPTECGKCGKIGVHTAWFKGTYFLEQSCQDCLTCHDCHSSVTGDEVNYMYHAGYRVDIVLCTKCLVVRIPELATV